MVQVIRNYVDILVVIVITMIYEHSLGCSTVLLKLPLHG